MRKIASFCLTFTLAAAAVWVAQGASADSVQEKLDKARQDQTSARKALSDAETLLENLMADYLQLRTDLDLAAKDIVATQAAQEDLDARLAEAQEQLSRRVTTAYELG